MPRVGYSPAEQRAGGSKFAFQPGFGKVENATIAIEHLGSWPAVGVRVTVQRLDAKFKPTDDESITQFLPLASVTKQDGESLFQPAKADGPDDDDPTPLGEEEDTEGNCLFAMSEDLKVDKSLGGSIFMTSLAEHGFPIALLNGYAPHLIGLVADFDQVELKKSATSTAKNPPTALVVKKIIEMSDSAKGKGGKAAASGKTNVPAAPAKDKEKEKTKDAGKKKDAPAKEASNNGSDEVDGDIEALLIKCLVKQGEKFAGQTVTVQKLGTNLLMTMPKVGAKPAQQGPIQELFENRAWFDEKAKEMDWEVEDDSVTIPAA